MVLDVPAEEAKRRAAADERPEWTDAAIDRWWSRYEPNKPPIPRRDGPSRKGEAVTADPTPEPADDPKTDPPAPADPDPAAATADDRLPDDHPVVKALHKANEEAKQARLKVQEFEDAQKSEVDKLNDRIKELEPTAHEAARLRVALDKGLTLKQAKRLSGDTEEELAADADDLLEDLGTRPTIPTRPSGQGGGSAPSDADDIRSPAELANAVVKRRGY